MLVLASGSPRRRDLLRQAGVEFEVEVADVGEELRPGEAAEDYVRRLAEEKAGAVFRRRGGGAGLRVLGADTAVVLGGEVLGKPVDESDARRMLGMLSGRVHRVLTGVALVSAGGVVSGVEETRVEFRVIGGEEMEVYLAGGQAMDKAGAYGIQGYAGRWAPRVEGCFFNVMGLPVSRVVEMLGLSG